MEHNEVVSVKWHQSILFRVILTNVIMLLVFVLVMYTSITSLNNTASTSSTMLEYISGASASANNVASDTYYLYGQPYAYYFADEEYRAEIVTYVAEVNEEILEAAEHLSTAFASSNDTTSQTANKYYINAI